MRIASALLFASLLGTAAADPAPLAVVVRGAPEAATVRARIASELGTSIVAVDRCRGACLEVLISKSTATVAYTTAGGVTRARHIELGPDKAQWPTVIALLAGNVARDEAADVLAQLPKPAPKPAPKRPMTAPIAIPIPAVGPAPLPEPADPVPEPEAEAPEAPVEDLGPVTSPSQVEVPEAEPVEPMIVLPPIAPPTPAPLPVVSETYDRPAGFALAVGFVPGLSTDGMRIGQVRHLIGFHAIAGVSGGSDLLSIAGIADIQRGTASGLQLAGIASVADRSTGIQIGGIAAVASEGAEYQLGGIGAFTRGNADLQIGGIGALARGDAAVQVGGIGAAANSSSLLQIGGIGAVARRSATAQVAGIGALAGDHSDLQIGGIGTLTRGYAHAQIAGIAAVAGTAELQVGGIAAVTRGEGNVQIGGIATVAGSANVQVAGIANIADRLRGVQFGTVNIARRVEGVQVGVVNIGGNAGGSSFGLINIIKGGRTDLEGAIDSDRIGTVLLRHGGHGWHNVYGIAGQQIDEGGGDSNDVWMYGLGFGPSWRRGTSRVDLELMGWQVNHGAAHSTDVSVLGQLRATYALQLGGISLIAGGAINGYVSNDRMSPLALDRRKPSEMMDDEVHVTVWPSAFVGVRL